MDPGFEMGGLNTRASAQKVFNTTFTSSPQPRLSTLDMTWTYTNHHNIIGINKQEVVEKATSDRYP